VQFDFDKSVIRTFTDRSPKPDWGSPHKIHFSDGKAPMLDLRLAGSEVESFVLDTGFSGSVALYWAVFHKLKSAGEVHEGEPYALATIDGFQSTREGRLSAISLGDFEHRNLSVTSSNGPCRVGLGFLRRYKATFDLDSGILYLQKGARFAEPDRAAPIGFSCLREDSRYVLISITRGSFAEEAGLKPGDELILVDDESLDERPIAEIVSLVRTYAATNGGHVALTIQRDGVRREVVLSLKRPRQLSESQLAEDSN
jgi:hypothetical protein